MVVRRWDASVEAFAPGAGMDSEEEGRYAAGVRRHDFDGTTGPYPLESLQKWQGSLKHTSVPQPSPST